MIKNGEELKLKTAIEERERLKHIRRFMGGDLRLKKVLELGAGEGILANLLIQNGAAYTGIEPSSLMYELAIKNFPNLKNNLINTPFDKGTFEKDYFDAVLLIDVFEHIPEPLNFLKKIKFCLKQDGILYIEVPNENFLKFKGFLRNKIGLYGGYPTHPAHVNLFTNKTLRKIFEFAGMIPIAIFQLTVWGNKQRLRLALKNQLPKGLCSASVFLRLTKLDLILGQGNLVVAAKK